jgi:hypothetical protein
VDVERHAGLRERGELGGDHDRGDVLRLEVLRIDRDAELLQHLRQTGLHHRRARVIARAVETDDEAEAGQVVLANSADRGEVLDAICMRVRRGDAEQRDDE